MEKVESWELGGGRWELGLGVGRWDMGVGIWEMGDGSWGLGVKSWELQLLRAGKCLDLDLGNIGALALRFEF